MGLTGVGVGSTRHTAGSRVWGGPEQQQRVAKLIFAKAKPYQNVTAIC